jgi:hypothetical protein
MSSLRLTDAAAQNPKNRPPQHLTYLSEFTHQVATVASVTCGSTSLGPTSTELNDWKLAATLMNRKETENVDDFRVQ